MAGLRLVAARPVATAELRAAVVLPASTVRTFLLTTCRVKPGPTGINAAQIGSTTIVSANRAVARAAVPAAVAQPVAAGGPVAVARPVVVARPAVVARPVAVVPLAMSTILPRSRIRRPGLPPTIGTAASRIADGRATPILRFPVAALATRASGVTTTRQVLAVVAPPTSVGAWRHGLSVVRWRTALPRTMAWPVALVSKSNSRVQVTPILAILEPRLSATRK